jgi:hypothetical protein
MREGKPASSFAIAVCFCSWGERASPRDLVHLDMWDDYFERT